MSQRRKYSKEFKLEAVRLANTPGVTLKQIGEEPGVNPHLLGKWRKWRKWRKKYPGTRPSGVRNHLDHQFKAEQQRIAVAELPECVKEVIR